MSDTIHTGSQTFRKNPSGDFEVPIADLASLRFTQVPYYSTVKIGGLPGTPESYGLRITATHAGGPHNEQFSLSVQVHFQVLGNGQDPQVVGACNRRRRHVRRFFRDVAALLQLHSGPDIVPFYEMDAGLYCIVAFWRDFERAEDPMLLDMVQPFVTRFVELLKAKDPLLFLCHASEDKPFVDRLCAFLDAQQVAIWYDRREIKVGDSIVRRISDGLGLASHLVIVLSRAAVTKEWVLKEVSAALMRQLQTSAITVLPLLAENCALPPILSDIKYADCRGDPDQGFRELLEALL
jgi:hypothetical protein